MVEEASSPASGGRGRSASAGRHAAALLLLVAAMAWSYAGLATKHVIHTHESISPYLRVQEYQAEIAAGHLPPQVFPGAVGGGGFAFPRYYPPFSYWISCGTSWAAGDPVAGVHLSFGLSVLLSVLLFYRMAVRMTGSAWLALLGAVLYGTATYRFVDVLVRGALAESWIFVWLPLIAWGTGRAARSGAVSWVLPVAIGGLLLTHTVLAGYAIAASGAAILASSVLTRRLAPVGAFVVAVTLGCGLAAWYLLPSLSSLGAVWAGEDGFMWTDLDRVTQQAVAVGQLFVDDPSRWFGLSVPGDADGMSFALGAADLLVLPLTLAVLLAAVRARKRGENRDPWLGAGTVVGVASLWAACVAFVVKPGPMLAILPHPFRYIQFPWRLLGFATFLSATACVACLHRLGSVSGPRVRGGIDVAAAVGAILIVGTVPAHHREANTGPATAATLHDQRAARQSSLGYTLLGEYLPQEMDPREAMARVEEAAEAAARTPGVERLERNGSTTGLRVNLAAPLDLVLPVVYYDFYAARTEEGRTLRTRSDGGLLAVHLPEGAYSADVTPRLGAMGWTGLLISLASAAGITALGARRRSAR